jgi:GntR family transcriptional regulator/MocR family aminotransferase
VPPDLVDAFTSAKALLDRHSTLFEQIVLADFFSENHFARHVRRMRNLYAERRDTLIAAVQNNLNDLLEITPSVAGLHLMSWLRNGIDDLTASRAAADNGVTTEPLSALCLKRKLRPGLVLGYASFNEKEIEEGVARLRTALQTIRKT